jgi:hypothetical protein
MTDSISLLMFTIPCLIAIIFSMMSLVELKNNKAQVTGIFSSLVASISWSIFGLLWPALSTQDMFVSIAYLWYAMATIFAVLTLYTGLKMMGAIFQEKPQQRLVMVDDGGED